MIASNRRLAILPLAAIAGAALCGAALAQDGRHGASDQSRTLTVQETAEASAAPDYARLDFQVLRTAEDAREAVAAANSAMADVQGALRELGIEERDLQTSQYSIEPQYRHDDPQATPRPSTGPEIIGYAVRQGLTVRVRDIARVGEVLDRAIELGVNSGGSIFFDIEDRTALRNEARGRAIERAREAATMMADAAGLELGDIRRILEANEMQVDPRGPMMMRMEAASDGAPIAAGETSVAATVTVTFDLAGGERP